MFVCCGIEVLVEVVCEERGDGAESFIGWRL